MKEKKKVVLDLLRKQFSKDDRVENQVIELAMKKVEGARDDGWGVVYSKGGKRLIAAKKTLEGAYTVREDTLEICDYAFWGCAFVRSVAMPASVTHIGDEAFAHCLSLESVYLPPSVETMGRNPFVGLDAKVVKNQSPHFAVDSKILYDADRTLVVSCLTDASMIILPKTVRTVGPLAFTRRSKLRKVQLPDGLETIGRDAFSDCAALEEVVIPATVTAIGPYAFAECDSLRKVTFLGSPERVARTAFSDCDSLASIIVPEGKERKFRKQLHLAQESDVMVLPPAQESSVSTK